MKEKIIEVQNYFVEQIENGDFEVVKVTENTVTILVDEYEFQFLIGSTYVLFCSGIIKIETVPTDLIQSIHKKHEREIKLAQIEKLQSEI